MVKRASEMSYPYLHDLTQNVATAYGAENSEFYLISDTREIVYRDA